MVLFIYVKENRFILKILFLAIAINLFLTSMLIVGIPYIVKITMGASNFLYGLAEGAISFSSLVAAVSIGIFSKYLKVTNLHIPFIICALIFVPMAVSVYPFILKYRISSSIFNLYSIIYANIFYNEPYLNICYNNHTIKNSK